MNSLNNDSSCMAMHNHQHCMQQAIKKADEYCKQHKLRLTHLRRKVLSYIWESHVPAAAYTILRKLADDGYNPSPPTVYRSLDFLMQHQLVHKITSLNAYIGCQYSDHKHCAQFFICSECGVATEIEDKNISHQIESDGNQLGFNVQHQTIEISGICQQCQNQ